MTTIASEGLPWLASAVGFALVMSVTPGPNNAMLAASGANFGLRRTLPHLMGVALGFPVMLVLVALGAAELLRAAPGLQQALRWAGAAWLLWLAWRMVTAEPVAATAEVAPARRAPRPMSFLAAALFQWANPKAWMIAASGVTAYTGAEVPAQAAILALIFALTSLPACVGWAALGAGMGRLLPSPAALRLFNRAMAALLVLSLVPVLAG